MDFADKLDMMYDDCDIEGFYLYDARTPTIKEIRTACNMTQIAFAAELHIPRRTIENWEMKKRAPHAYIVELIAFRMAETIEKNKLK